MRDGSREPQSEFVRRLCDAAVRGAEEKIGLDPVVLDVRGLLDCFDALVIVGGRNDRQVRAIAEEIERQISLELGVTPVTVEGFTGAEWVALDYGDVIVHVFDEPNREYYDLEHLWRSAPAVRRSVAPTQG